jgi:beta-glucosidase
VAQLYIGYPAAANEPPKLLKGFQKVQLVDSAGSCAGVAFPLSAQDLSVWDSSSMAWRLVPGTYQVMVGSTSADIRLRGTLSVG